MLGDRHFNRCLGVVAALWVLEVAWIALPGDPTMSGAPWGAAAFFGSLLFGTWMRARPAYWVFVVSEALALTSSLVWILFLSIFAALPLIAFTGARLALLLSKPVRGMVGRPRYRASMTPAT